MTTIECIADAALAKPDEELINAGQRQAILTLAFLAAYCDSDQCPREHDQLRRLAESLAGEMGARELLHIDPEMFRKRVSLTATAAVLIEREYRQLAYEMAACVCDADGRMTTLEQKFLSELAVALRINDKNAQRANNQAEALAELADDAAPASSALLLARSTLEPMILATPTRREAANDERIVDCAIISGALELLPHTWASMAFIPLQIRMIYGIGKTHGYQLVQMQIRDLLSSIGGGLRSQYIAQSARQLRSGLWMVTDSPGEPFGHALTHTAASFATTYALGRVANQYYAEGAKMSDLLLNDGFQHQLNSAEEKQSRVLPQIQAMPSWI